jgi:hypothetical protein
MGADDGSLSSPTCKDSRLTGKPLKSKRTWKPPGVTDDNTHDRIVRRHCNCVHSLIVRRSQCAHGCMVPTAVTASG